MTHRYLPAPSPEDLGLVPSGEGALRRSGNALPKLKRFRFQLMHEWIRQEFPKCRVADVGGGKGLLAYLLIRDGFDATVIDPVRQSLPRKFRDLTGRRVGIPPDADVPRIARPYSLETGRKFDLLIAMHAHGVNMSILDTVARMGTSCVLMPCCVIDEPETPPRDDAWFDWLVRHATDQGLKVDYFYLNFKGQNVGFYIRGPLSAVKASGHNESRNR